MLSIDRQTLCGEVIFCRTRSATFRRKGKNRIMCRYPCWRRGDTFPTHLHRNSVALSLPKPAYGPASGSRDFPKRTPRSYSLLSWKSTTTHHLSKRGHRLQYFLPYLRKAVGDRATSRIPSSHQSGRTSDGFPPLRQHREAEPWDGTPCDAVLRLAGRQSFHGA